MEVGGRWVGSPSCGPPAASDLDGEAAVAPNEMGAEGSVCSGERSVGHSRVVVGRSKRSF